MTFEEKVGQLMQFNGGMFMQSKAEVTGPLTNMGLPENTLDYVGSVLNFDGAGMMTEIQKRHLASDRLKIPMLFMMDVIHGYKTIFPIPLSFAASFDPEMVAKCMRMMAKEAAAGGVHATFSPMADLVRDNRWGRVMESCGEDPHLNSVMCEAQVKAIQGDDLKAHNNIAACVKHIAAYGGAESGKDYNQVEISERLLREYYFPAYKACVDAGVRMLMPSFNNLNGVPSTANSWLMKDIVRGEWEFDGVVITDYQAISELVTHGIAEDQKDATEIGFNNFNDIEMVSTCYFKHLRALAEEGKIKEEDIDRAVERVLQLKADLGLFDDPFRGTTDENERATCLTAEHREIARSCAEQSAILLKNDGVLPFSENVKRVAVIGPYANDGQIIGGWSCAGSPSDAVTAENGVKALLGNAEVISLHGCDFDSEDRSGFAEAIAAAKQADAVILCLGEPRDYSAEAESRASTDLPGVQNELAQIVAAANPNTVAVLFNGRPLVLKKLSRAVPAILEMFFPGTEGGSAMASLLFGRSNPSGKVTMSFPQAVGQAPLYYNYTSTGRPKPCAEDEKRISYCSSYLDCGNLALYPFGYGLSYTSFEYESLELDKTEMATDEEIKVKITLRNSGSREGKEVVQLYMRDMVASSVRPVQQLIAFEKTVLKAGERKTVEFKVREDMLRFYNFECEYISEPGEFRLSTGYADNLILTKSFWLKK